jgi:ABC-type transport system involved in multi-copper enzyme maturation permease subunit
MNPLVEVWLILGRELRKNLRSAKGLIMIGLSLLGAMACTFRIPKIEEGLAEAQRLGPDQLHEAKAKLFGEMYMNEGTGENLASAPIKLVVLFYLAVWLAPLLVAILGFDGVPSEIQYRTVRYWTVRCRRSSYYVGKFLGLWVVVSLITLVMHSLIWVVTIARGEATTAETLHWGVRFFLVSLPIGAAWCGIATLISSFLRTPVLALLLTCATFFMLFFVGAIVGRSSHNETLQLVYPNSYDAWILSPDLQRAVAGVAIMVGFALVTTVVGAFVFSTRDV